MVIVPRMTTPEELERACHKIIYAPMEQREVWADAILKAVAQLRFTGAVDEQSAGQYRQVLFTFHHYQDFKSGYIKPESFLDGIIKFGGDGSCWVCCV